MPKLSPVHPGEILKAEFLEPRGLSAHSLALALRVPASRVYEILRGRRSVSAETALRLARHFGNSPEFWTRLQADYDLAQAADRGFRLP